MQEAFFMADIRVIHPLKLQMSVSSRQSVLHSQVGHRLCLLLPWVCRGASSFQSVFVCAGPSLDLQQKLFSKPLEPRLTGSLISAPEAP